MNTYTSIAPAFFKASENLHVCAISRPTFISAKQRETTSHDWMTTDAEIACPDPHCGGQFRIKRLSKRRIFHAETICPGTGHHLVQAIALYHTY